MAKKHTSNDDEEKILRENVRKRFKDMFSGKHQPLSNASIQEVEELKARVVQLEKELAQEPESKPTAGVQEKAAPAPSLSQAPDIEPSMKNRVPFANTLSNISMRWKMGLMVLVFFLAMTGITLATRLGLQALRYHLSNIYDFMLVPILSISEADTALADTQYRLENIDKLAGSELTTGIESIQADTKLAKNIIGRYDTEWVTTTSAEFTQALQKAGKLELQQQEIETLESLRVEFNAYQAALTKYLTTVQKGHPDANLANEAKKSLRASRLALEQLIVVNNEFAGFSNSEAQAAYQQALRASLFVLGISLVFVSFISYLVVVSITGRLNLLTRSAAAIQQGNLDQLVSIAGHDEVGLLGSAFNAMTARLKDLFNTMERRVEQRTHDLELAAEVGRTVAEKPTDLSEMLTNAAEIIRSRFDLYYTQIYLMDPSGERINLYAGTGIVGKELLQRKHYLAINFGSLNGRAVVEKRAQIVTDTTENPNFLPNPLLPNTRSEMSIPLMVSDRVVGILDMQSEQPGALSEANLPAFQALAGQLAIAIQNAALFAEAQEARTEVEAQIRRFTEQGWQDFLDAIHHGHKIGFVFDESKVIRLSSEVLSKTSEADGVQLPISVAGAKIGEIHLPAESKQALPASDLELIQTTGAQLAQHVENLRLLAQAERYRAEAEQAIRRLTHEGWENFLQAYGELEPGYLYDLIEVKPLANKSNSSSDHAIKHPMLVGDQMIGELAVEIPSQSEEASELLAAVAEQLSGHIENLRLSELNERRAQREQTLRQITSLLRSSNNPATILRTAVRELGSITGRRTVVQLAAPQRDSKNGSVASHDNKSDTPVRQS